MNQEHPQQHSVKMKITELKPGQGSVDIELDIVSIEEPREFEKYGKTLKVANALAKDDSGQIKFSLWNEDIDKVKPGNKIKITNGYVSEFQGEKQLSAGKYGSFEVVGAGKAESEPAKEEAPTKEEAPKEEPQDSEEESLL